jgi:hypothetical protein
MPKTNTVRRDVLRRMIEAGKMEAKVNYRYSDDYAFDNATNFGKTEWLPATVSDQRKYFNGIAFAASDFRGYGSAWKEKDGSITLYFGYLSYSIREKAPVALAA